MPPRPKSKRTASLPVAIKDHKHVATRPVMLLVLGPHRSGTSLTTRMLECLGAENSQKQWPPHADNPRGFFEDADILTFNESQLLPRLGLEWHSIGFVDWSQLSKTDRSRLGLQALEIIRRNYPLSNPLSVLKEPRINNTLPFWVSLLEHAGFNVRFVCAVRDPVSAARSLAKRDGFSLTHGSMIYLSAWLSVLPHLQERQVAFVQFDEIFVTPGKVLGKVADKLGLPLPPDFDQRVHVFTSAHLDTSLRHSTLPREDVMLEPDLPPLVAELYRVLLDAAQSQNIRKTAKFLAYAERQIESLGPLLADYDAKQTRLASLQTESQAAQAECARLQSQLTDSSHQGHAVITAERDAVVAERETLRSRISALEAEHSELASRHQQLATVLEDLKGQQTSVLTERDTLAQERELIRSERDTLAQERSNLIAERDDLTTRYQQLATALEALQGEHSSLSTLHSSLIAERDDLVTRRTSLATALEELQGHHSSLAAERDALATRHQQLATALESLQSQHCSLVAERDALATRVTALESELAGGSHLSALQMELLAERNSLSRTIKERDGTARERDQFAARLIKLERDHHALTKSEHLLKISHRKLEERFARANAALALLKNSQDEAATLRAALAALRAEKVGIIKDRDRLNARISTLEAEHDKLAASHASLVAERDALRAALEDRITALKAESAYRTQELNKTARSRDDLQQTVARQNNELATLTRQLVETQDQQSSRTSEINSLKTHNSELTTTVNALKAQHASLVADSEALGSERNRLRYDIEARFKDLAVLSKHLIGLERDLKDARQAAWDCGALGCKIEQTRIESVQETPPYQHLQFELKGVTRPDRLIEQLRFRLVQHHGRLGFCLLSPGQEHRPVDRWVEAGEEHGEPYMLVIPSNKSGAQLIKGLTEVDTALIRTILAAAGRALRAQLASNNNASLWPQQPLHDWLTRAQQLADNFCSASSNSRSQLAFISAAR